MFFLDLNLEPLGPRKMHGMLLSSSSAVSGDERDSLSYMLSCSALQLRDRASCLSCIAASHRLCTAAVNV